MFWWIGKGKLFCFSLLFLIFFCNGSLLLRLCKILVKIVVIIRYGLVLVFVMWYFMWWLWWLLYGICRVMVWLLWFYDVCVGIYIFGWKWWYEFMFGVSNVIDDGIRLIILVSIFFSSGEFLFFVLESMFLLWLFCILIWICILLFVCFLYGFVIKVVCILCFFVIRCIRCFSVSVLL